MAGAEKRTLQLENLVGIPPAADGPCLKLSLEHEEVSRIFRFLKVPRGSGYFLTSARKRDTPVQRLRSGTPYDQPVHALAHVAEVSLVTRFEFGNGAPRVANFAKRLAHRLPVHVPIT